jgi:hypothetical protein
MNMNANLKMDLNAQSLKAMLPLLMKAQPYIYGVVLIAVFAYTANVINQSLNVQPAPTQSEIKPLPKITFDKPTIKALNDLKPVNGDVPLGDLGKDNPLQ